MPPPLDFIAGLEQELRLRGLSFGRADVLVFADDVWRLAHEDPDPVRWADAFVETRYARHRLPAGCAVDRTGHDVRQDDPETRCSR
jgi:hypothetical protein